MPDVETGAGPDKLRMILLNKRTKQKNEQCLFCMKQTDPPHNYMLCPERPCYLCGRKGHQQMNCEFQVTQEQSERTMALLLASRARKSRALHFPFEAQIGRAVPGDLHFRSPQLDAKGKDEMASLASQGPLLDPLHDVLQRSQTVSCV